ncbi:nickel-dependent lactate racemase [Cloacibacillus sp. An23]|uniref:nickel-dependent lactate racemase n=1 Tax=Cloacibacillus sp. An23 TaxID=1965591 RepID=UPI000B38CF17|nr:nickel-dependent lactate racemase [Cloacibacillus sp. An23]OUO93017.1 lactate racemization operon protein LarA [Cloacibacillus sp. An23]
MEIKIPYGKTYQTLDIKEEYQLVESKIQELGGGADGDRIVLEAMASPIASPKLSELAAGKKNAVVIISDHTRPVPSKQIIPHMLAELRAGNPDIDITLLVATGCHRGTTPEELVHKLGEEIASRERIVVHDCDSSPLTELGVLPSGARLVVNSLVANAELVVSEGFIEPHFFAGFSGGRKSILPGVCSRVTVLGNHCADFIDDPKSRMGVIDGNPINRDMECAARMAKLAYIVNVVVNEAHEVVAAFAGDAIEAHHAGCAYLAKYCEADPAYKADIVITSNGGAPLDQNVYQAVKGLTTAADAAGEDGALIICAECADGIGGDSFYKALSECSTPEELLEEIRRVPMDETVPDQWQYQILARILEKHHVYFVTRPELEKEITAMKMEYAPSLEEAYARARALRGASARVTVIPNGVSLIIKQ